MKKNLAVLFLFCTLQGYSQITNVKTGLWSDPTAWSNHLLPIATDDIILSFNVTVDINAVCKSLTLNGHSVTVNTGVNLNIAGSTDASLLSQYIEVDTTLSAPFDTLTKTLFYYDNIKRNTRIDIIYYEDGEPQDYQTRTTFFYSGNDTVPFKRTYFTPLLTGSSSNYINDTCFYSYANGMLVLDSTVYSHGGKLANKYAYSAGTITSISDQYFTDFTIRRFDTVQVTYTNQNITKQTGSIDTAPTDFRYVYNNYPNPFYHTQNKLVTYYGFPYYLVETSIPNFFTRNNAIEIDQYSNQYNYHIKLFYEYNVNGYPKVVRYYDQNHPAIFGKALYFYTN